MMKLLGVANMLIFLMVVTVSWEYIYVKTYQIICSKYM